MQQYLKQLIDDIRKASRIKSEMKALDSVDSAALLAAEEIDRVIQDNNELPFSNHCGLTVDMFPPADRLEIKDIKKLIREFRKMMITWNLTYAFPDGLPLELEYQYMVDILNEKLHILDFGRIVIDYCDGSPEGCKFGEYCYCLSLENCNLQ